jgi:hypothetical protein
MPGLIEALGGSTGDPNKDAAINQGILQMGLQMLQSRGSFGQALGQGGTAGLQAFNGEQDRQFQQKQRLQQQQVWEDQNRQMQRRKQMEDLAPQFHRSAVTNNLANGKGPTLENAATLGQAKPSYDWDGYIAAIEGIDPLRALELRAATTKDGTELLSEGQVRYDKRTGKPLYGNPKSEAADPLTKLIAARNSLPPNHPDRPAYDAAIKKATTHQPGTSVSVNTGQKGFDNTLKLRDGFKSEPTYKAHQEMTSAYSQIQQSLKQGTPAGDLAGATKIMKLLDPGSVVRESELGMAMAATGLLDRVQNYANLVVTGQKLTPQQRKEFQTLADALYGESVKQYNAKRSEYQGISARNGLNEDDVLGPPSMAPKAPAGGPKTDLGGGFFLK